MRLWTLFQTYIWCLLFLCFMKIRDYVIDVQFLVLLDEKIKSCLSEHCELIIAIRQGIVAFKVLKQNFGFQFSSIWYRHQLVIAYHMLMRSKKSLIVIFEKYCQIQVQPIKYKINTSSRPKLRMTPNCIHFPSFCCLYLK